MTATSFLRLLMSERRRLSAVVTVVVGGLALGACQTSTDRHGNTRVSTPTLGQMLGGSVVSSSQFSAGSPSAGGATVVPWEKDANGPAHKAARGALAKTIKDARRGNPKFSEKNDVYAAIADFGNGNALLFTTLAGNGGFCGSAGCNAWVFKKEGGQWKPVLSNYIADEGADITLIPNPGAGLPDLAGYNRIVGNWHARYDAAKGIYR